MHPHTKKLAYFAPVCAYHLYVYLSLSPLGMCVCVGCIWLMPGKPNATRQLLFCHFSFYCYCQPVAAATSALAVGAAAATPQQRLWWQRLYIRDGITVAFVVAAGAAAASLMQFNFDLSAK